MSQLDAFALSQALRKRLVEFSLERNFVRDRQLTQICQQLWEGTAERGGLVGDLWVEGAFPAETAAETLADLAESGEFDSGLQDHLHARGVVPRERKLYWHQREAIREAQRLGEQSAKPALVITAGTGAGKTESFLLPVLNDLFRQPRGQRQGVRCIILYPMNALVNDQVDRVHEWLSEQDDITLFHFTSETPEDSRQANQDHAPRWEKEPFRIRTRQEARGLETHQGKAIDLQREPRGRVPDILITNYSMLEYMLSRPQDGVFFGDALRALVLDEAHLYTGTLAAEITLLLRRLLRRCGLPPEQVLQLATSATIGSGAAGELEDFASQLFTKRRDLVRVIRGRVQEYVPPPSAPPAQPPVAATVNAKEWLVRATQSVDGKALIEDAEQCHQLNENLPLFVAEAEVLSAAKSAGQKPAVLLYEALGRAPLFQQAKLALAEQQRLSLRNLARLLWHEDSQASWQATITMLQMGAAARNTPGGHPLLPHRLHLLARPTDGLVVCLNDACAAPANLKLQGLGGVSAGYMDHCSYCRSATLSLERCANCGETVLAGINDKHRKSRRFWPIPQHDRSLKVLRYSWQPCAPEPSVWLERQTGEPAGAGMAGLPLYQVSACPHCQADAPADEAGRSSDWRSFVTSAEQTLSLLAETALAELPELPNPNNAWLPARGRRMLAFSDSRTEAARLGPRLRLQHEIRLVRAALARCAVKTPAADEATIQYLEESLATLRSQLAAPALTPYLRQHLTKQYEQIRQSLSAARQGGAIEMWLELLKQEAGIDELLDVETAHKHEAETWRHLTKREWDANAGQIHQHLLQLVGWELARTPLRRVVSVETLGLLEVAYPGLEALPVPEQIAGVLPTAAGEALAQAWSDFLAALCDTLRMEGVVTLREKGEQDGLQYGRIPIGRWAAEEKRRGQYLLSFIGQRDTQRRRQFARVVLERAGLPAEQAIVLAPDLLRAAYRQLKQHAGRELHWLKVETQQTNDSPIEALQIYFPHLTLRRPPQLYRCDRTGHIWPRSVLGCSYESTLGRLQPVSHEELNHDPRVGRQRTELESATVFELALWAEEHSAQLAPRENRRLQDLFKLGVRNILSSTTTLELGIDIGGLNAVLLSNVPPSKANYLQRAGRAGRRADGSSVVLTFARPCPFDREVFARFGDYLARAYRSPQIFLDRQRVVRRHGHAFLLGEFFRQVYPPGMHVSAMKAFGNMGRFCGVSFIPYWERSAPKPALIPAEADWDLNDSACWLKPDRQEVGLEKHFLDFLGYLRQAGASEYQPALEALFQGTPLRSELVDWEAYLTGLERSFLEAVHDWRKEYDSLLSAWSEIGSAGGTGRNQQAPSVQANMLHYQSRALYEMTVIEAFADRQFLPRYGFPIGMQKLRVIQPDEKAPNRIREEDQYRLERSGLLALREYVPGSQLLVGGRLVTSHGLLKHWTGAELDNYLGLRGNYAVCQQGHTYYKLTTNTLGDCSICGAPSQSVRALLLPKHGFSSAAWDPPRLSADVERIGQVERATVTFARDEIKADLFDDQFGGIAGLSARYREGGEILVYNEGELGRGFAICLQCGYAASEHAFAPEDLPPRFSEHARLTAANDRYPCWGKHHPSVLRNQTLAARETTDVLLLTFSDVLRDWAKDAVLLQTLGYALQIAGAKLLELDTREVGVMVAAAEEFKDGVGAVLYDNVPGGAGHVRELFAQKRRWLTLAEEVLYIDEKHDARCETACLDCLLTYDAQEAMNRGLLHRRKAYALLHDLLAGQVPLVEPDGAADPLHQEARILTTETGSLLTKQDRLARGKDRMRR
jgi:DEAD/DEAH box helicase domain-containing protein